MLELFGFTTGNSFRAAIALEESELPYVQRTVDLGRGDQHADAYRLINPTARVPTLIDPSGAEGKRLVLTQSNAIMLHVAEKSGTLLPSSGSERIRALEWLFFFVTDVIAPSNQGSFLRSSGVSSPTESSDRLQTRAAAMYSYVDQWLEAHTFLAGDRFTVADIAGYTITSYLSPHRSGALPNVSRWFELVSARPAVLRGMAAFR